MVALGRWPRSDGPPVPGCIERLRRKNEGTPPTGAIASGGLASPGGPIGLPL